MTEQKFYELCKAHDLCYVYSDDTRVYEAGIKSVTHIHTMSLLLPRADAVRIWNSVVDEKLVASAREAFYWTE